MARLRVAAPKARYFSPHASQISSLTAAAQRVAVGQGPSFERLGQPWQRKALSYYDLAGECRYSAKFHANALSQVRLFPARMDGTEIEETDDQAGSSSSTASRTLARRAAGMLANYGS